MNDPFVSCPYEPQHRVPKSRIQNHIIKCMKNHPTYLICPYNATHRYPHEAQMNEHVKTCPTKLQMEPPEPQVVGAMGRIRPVFQRDYLPEDDPDNIIWDD